MALTRDIVNLDALELITTPLRTPAYALEGERLFNNGPATIDSVIDTLVREHPELAPYHIWPFRATEHIELIPDGKTGYKMPRSTDLLFSVRFVDSLWTGSAPVDGGLTPLSSHLARILSKAWRHDGTPFARLLAGYIQGTYQTPYIRLARQWIEQGMSVGILDVILGYAYGPDILRLMKLPPASSVIEPEWELVPVTTFNDLPVDIWNLDPREPLAVVALPYNDIRTTPLLVERGKKSRELGIKLRFRLPPPVFFATTMLMERSALDEGHTDLCRAPLIRYPSLGSFIGMDGASGFRDADDMICPNPLAPEPHPWKPECQFCQLCEAMTAQCSECSRMDLLFCPEHSGVVEDQVVMGRHKVWCYACQEKHLETNCRNCMWTPIGHCWLCSQRIDAKLCEACAGWPRIDEHWVCPACHARSRCDVCRLVRVDTKSCEQCVGHFCPDCNPIVSIDISPGTLWPDRVVHMIAHYTLRCRRCMAGRTPSDIQEEERRQQAPPHPALEWGLPEGHEGDILF